MPADPVLAEWAAALRDAGDWGWVVDARWNVVYMTDEMRLSFAAGVERVPIVIGEHMFGPTVVALGADWRTGPTMARSWRDLFGNAGGMVLADTPGGRAELRSLVDPSLADIVDDLSPSTASVVTGQQIATATVGGGAVVAGAPQEQATVLLATRVEALRGDEHRLARRPLPGRRRQPGGTRAAAHPRGDRRHAGAGRKRTRRLPQVLRDAG